MKRRCVSLMGLGYALVKPGCWLIRVWYIRIKVSLILQSGHVVMLLLSSANKVFAVVKHGLCAQWVILRVSVTITVMHVATTKRRRQFSVVYVIEFASPGLWMHYAPY